jgi:Protein of unknown function (DUF3300)/Chaperone of endosialidase
MRFDDAWEAQMILRAIWSIGLALFILAPGGVNAQTSSPPPAAPTPQVLKPAELDQLVAPIALYPDPLLAEVLMASTYPLDIVQAERWLQSNKNLKDEALKAAADKQDWDPSIKALLATPDVLEMMSSRLDWTQKLGDAVVAQQADVMDAIQRLRNKAQANNKLPSTTQQTVTVTKTEGGGQVIAIEPTDPNTVYVPYYDPGVVYGDWSYPEYPPYYWPAPGYIGAGIIATGIAFGTGYALGRWAAGGNYWGGNVNWRNNNININRPINGGGGGNWRPNVEHRNATRNRGGRQQGLTGRGSGGNQVINPGGNRGNQGGNRANAGGNRGNQGGNRANAGGNRGNQGGNRANAGGNRSKAGAGSRKPSAAKTNHGNANRGRPSGGAGHHRAATGARAPGGAARAHAGARAPGGAARAHAGGGAARGGAARGGGGRGGGGRRSDIRVKHDIILLGYLSDGLGFYRFSYNGSEKAYVGVIAQEVQRIAPAAVARDHDGYLTVDYAKLGVPFESYSRWLRTGARIPSLTRPQQRPRTMLH